MARKPPGDALLVEAVALVELRGELGVARDGALHDLREERDEERVFEGVPLRGHRAPVDVHEVGDDLHREEREAERDEEPGVPEAEEVLEGGDGRAAPRDDARRQRDGYGRGEDQFPSPGRRPPPNVPGGMAAAPFGGRAGHALDEEGHRPREGDDPEEDGHRAVRAGREPEVGNAPREERTPAPPERQDVVRHEDDREEQVEGRGDEVHGHLGVGSGRNSRTNSKYSLAARTSRGGAPQQALHQHPFRPPALQTLRPPPF